MILATLYLTQPWLGGFFSRDWRFPYSITFLWERACWQIYLLPWPNGEIRHSDIDAWTQTFGCLSTSLRPFLKLFVMFFFTKDGTPAGVNWTHVVNKIPLLLCDNISYPLFADADTGIYPHEASHSRIRGSKQWVTNLSRAQTMFVTFLNVFAALKSQLSHLSGPKSPYKHNVTRSHRR